VRNIDEMIDAYIDNELDAQSLADFEQRLSVDAALRRQVEIQRRAEARLRELIAVPVWPGIDAEAATASESQAPAQPAAVIQQRRLVARPWMRIAAAVLLVGLIAISVGNATGHLGGLWRSLMPAAPSDLPADTIVNRYINDGFVPAVVCTTPELLAKYTREQLGREVDFKVDQSVQLVGWHYAGGVLADQAVSLMAKAGDKRMVVFMGKASDDRKVFLSPGSPLKLYRAEEKGLVFYEVTEASGPLIVSKLNVP
jgi:hypothetical protein